MKVNQTAKFVEKFNVKHDLMGLAIGSHGSNILKAREVPGITAIEVEDETCTIKVFGDVSTTRRSLVRCYCRSFVDGKSGQRSEKHSGIHRRDGLDSSRADW